MFFSAVSSAALPPIRARLQNCCSNDGTLLAQPSALAPSPHHATGSDAFPRLAQADVVSQIDVQLRQEMVEAQKEVARWTTEQKQVADAEARSGQRMLDEDKGAYMPGYPPATLSPSHPRPPASQRTCYELTRSSQRSTRRTRR